METHCFQAYLCDYFSVDYLELLKNETQNYEMQLKS